MVYDRVTRYAIAVPLVDKIEWVLQAVDLAWIFGRARRAAANTILRVEMAGLPEGELDTTCTPVR